MIPGGYVGGGVCPRKSVGTGRATRSTPGTPKNLVKTTGYTMTHRGSSGLTGGGARIVPRPSGWASWAPLTQRTTSQRAAG